MIINKDTYTFMIMADGLLSLSWNNHSSTFCHMLSTVRGLEKYSDVTLACDGRFYPAHKLVLSTCSDYFHKMFERTPCKHPVIVIKDVESKDIEALLSYMYAGIVNVSQNDLAQLIKAAELLEIKGLAVPDEPPLMTKRGSHTRSSSASPHRKRRKQEDRSSPGRHDTTPSSSSPRPKIAFGQSASGRQQDRKGQKHEEEKKGKTKSCEDDTDEQQSLTDQGERQIRNSMESSENQADGLNNSIKEEKVEQVSEGDGGMGGYEYGMLLGGMQEEGEDQGSASTPFSTTEHSFHSNPGPSGLQGWSGVGNGGESSQGYGGDLSQDLQLAGHLGTQAQQLHQVVREDEEGSRGCERSGNRQVHGAMTNPAATVPKTSVAKKHQCPYCWYSTSVSISLQRHIRTHTGEKPFRCPYCPARTTRKASLLTHIQGHTGEKPLSCSFCPFTSRQKSNMSRHIKSHHLGNSSQREHTRKTGNEGVEDWDNVVANINDVL
ncbi:hypothetical protein Pmani_003347 [Petrolisthes manimaculis]|uniref:Broad-complex n=1 Tax=Petrolisthes manimaculis TaxID=1843537 RepID=A0AAE1QIP8_9EUCA|nr:hypothetical protein Pmani_003347 [Petrolisthes manimaculis]